MLLCAAPAPSWLLSGFPFCSRRSLMQWAFILSALGLKSMFRKRVLPSRSLSWAVIGAKQEGHIYGYQKKGLLLPNCALRISAQNEGMLGVCHYAQEWAKPESRNNGNTKILPWISTLDGKDQKPWIGNGQEHGVSGMNSLKGATQLTRSFYYILINKYKALPLHLSITCFCSVTNRKARNEVRM